jgi:transcription antitermination factor NusG
VNSQPRKIDEVGRRVPVVWYALYTKYQHEKSSADLLARKGFDVLLPLYRATHRWKDRSQVVLLPVFPSYVFIRASLDQKLEVLRTPGVCWFVGNSGHAHSIPSNEIEGIRRISQGPSRFEPHPFLAFGDRVRIKSGVLAGLEGLLVRIKNQSRVVLCVELLQKAVAVEVDSSNIQTVSSTDKSAVPWLSKSKRTA